jgi:hypothetical protein
MCLISGTSSATIVATSRGSGVTPYASIGHANTLIKCKCVIALNWRQPFFSPTFTKISSASPLCGYAHGHFNSVRNAHHRIKQIQSISQGPSIKVFGVTVDRFGAEFESFGILGWTAPKASKASGSTLTFESRMGFPTDSTCASLAHANRNIHHPQAC